MRKINTEGIVLKSTNYADKDKIYTILTRDLGKIHVRGRGVRKITSKRAGSLDTLNYVDLKLTESSGFYNVDEVVVLESFKGIKDTLSTTLDAYYFTELVFRSVEEDVGSSDVFHLLLDALRKLSKGAGLVVNYFELNLLKTLGYSLNTEKCAGCGRDLDETWKSYAFNLDMGGFICEDCPGFGFKVFPETVLTIKNLQNGRFPSVKGVEDVSYDNVLKQVNSLVKGFVRDNLDARLKSLELTDR